MAASGLELSYWSTQSGEDQALSLGLCFGLKLLKSIFQELKSLCLIQLWEHWNFGIRQQH